MRNGALRQGTASIIASLAIAAASATCGLTLLGHPAHAQNQKNKEKAQSKAAAPVQVSTSPLVAVVSIGRQRVTFYDKNGAVAQSPISSGHAV